MDAAALFLLLAGFVIGLGAVTVIELHGFLARKSLYWTEATIKTHKVTKPLIWIGLFTALVGGVLFYRNEGLTLIPILHLITLTPLVLNGLFLTFVVSPYLLKQEREGKIDLLPQSLQTKIIISFVLSVGGWWGNLLLLVIYLTLGRQ